MERLLASWPFQLEHFAGESNHRHLGVGVAQIDYDPLVAQVELLDQGFGREIGQGFLNELPQLPLSQGIGQEDHDDLGADGVEAAGTKAGQVIEAFELSMSFFNGWPPGVKFD